ncbi:hypothetical protein Tco_1446514 [Tanacetum coccineum]
MPMGVEIDREGVGVTRVSSYFCQSWTMTALQKTGESAYIDACTEIGIDDAECDPEKDILLLEAILNSEPLSPLPNHANYFPELKDLPPHLEYAFLEGDNKLPVIIAKDLSVWEKAALIKVLQSHKRAIAWKLSDIKGINPEFCTHKILMEEDYTPAYQHQRRSKLERIQSHFMVKEGIVLGHKISKSGIEVDRAKIDVIAKLPHPTTVKGVRSFLGHAGFYRRFIQNFPKKALP